MKRLLQFVTIFFIVVTFLMPILEYFDRWDSPGLNNDTELPIFLIVLFIALVLVAMMAMARRFYENQNDRQLSKVRCQFLWSIVNPMKCVLLPLFIVPPLRI